MPCGTLMIVGAKFKMLVMPGCDERIGGILRSGAGRRDHADRDLLGLHDRSEFVDLADAYTTDDGADLLRVDVDDATDREPAFAETAVPGERFAEVAGADDHDVPLVGQAQLTLDLEHQELDVVADAAGAVAAEVGQVLADLGGVHATEFGQLLRRDVGGPELELVGQQLEVDGQPRDGRFGNPTSSPLASHVPNLGRLCTVSQSCARAFRNL